MVRRSIAVLAFLTALALPAAAETTPDVQLELGLTAFRAGDFPSAVVDLGSAAQGFLTPQELQTYVDTGRSDRLVPMETALVYLALSQFRLAQEDEARDTIERLLAVEKLAPTYANLPLPTDAAELETLVAALVPTANLPRNAQLAAVDPTRPLPSVTPVAPVNPTVPAVPPAPSPTDDEQQIARQAAVNTYLAFESERMARDATRTRLATPAVASAPPPPPIEQPIVPVPPRPTEPTSEAVRGYLTELRQAEAFGDNGLTAEADAIYTRILDATPPVPREVVTAAAIGLYRTGAYHESVEAFRRLGVFARGEEDLRYYHAVALYEIGEYAAAQKELACALPFIEMTDEVARYRLRIDQMTAAQQAALSR
jgi:tetratricopeptide (TPR) repeat protein